MIRTLVVCAMMVVLVGCQKSEPQPKADAVAIASTVIEVKTAKCEACAKTITKALERVDGVEKVSVNLEGKTVLVKYVPAKVTLAGLESAIAKAGYNANSMKRDDKAYQSLDACCQ